MPCPQLLLRAYPTRSTRAIFPLASCRERKIVRVRCPLVGVAFGPRLAGGVGGCEDDGVGFCPDDCRYQPAHRGGILLRGSRIADKDANSAHERGQAKTRQPRMKCNAQADGAQQQKWFDCGAVAQAGGGCRFRGRARASRRWLLRSPITSVTLPSLQHAQQHSSSAHSIAVDSTRQCLRHYLHCRTDSSSSLLSSLCTGACAPPRPLHRRCPAWPGGSPAQ